MASVVWSTGPKQSPSAACRPTHKVGLNVVTDPTQVVVASSRAQPAKEQTPASASITAPSTRRMRRCCRTGGPSARQSRQVARSDCDAATPDGLTAPEKRSLPLRLSLAR